MRGKYFLKKIKFALVFCLFSCREGESALRKNLYILCNKKAERKILFFV